MFPLLANGTPASGSQAQESLLGADPAPGRLDEVAWQGFLLKPILAGPDKDHGHRNGESPDEDPKETHGGDSEDLHDSHDGATVGLLFARYQALAPFKLLVAEAGPDIFHAERVSDSRGRNAMWYAMMRTNMLKQGMKHLNAENMLDYLFSNEAFGFTSYHLEDYIDASPPDVRDTPLHVAARNNHLHAFRPLIKHLRLRPPGRAPSYDDEGDDDDWEEPRLDLYSKRKNEQWALLHVSNGAGRTALQEIIEAVNRRTSVPGPARPRKWSNMTVPCHLGVVFGDEYRDYLPQALWDRGTSPRKGWRSLGPRESWENENRMGLN